MTCPFQIGRTAISKVLAGNLGPNYGPNMCGTHLFSSPSCVIAKHAFGSWKCPTADCRKTDSLLLWRSATYVSFVTVRTRLIMSVTFALVLLRKFCLTVQKSHVHLPFHPGTNCSTDQ